MPTLRDVSISTQTHLTHTHTVRTLASIVERKVYLHNRHWQCTTIGISNEACRRSLIHYCARHKKIKSLSAAASAPWKNCPRKLFHHLCSNMTTASAHPTQINDRKKKIIRMHLSPACIFIELSAAALVVGFINGSVFCLIAAAVSDKRDVQLSVCSRQ